ncbi:MAG: UDP-N-acetylmuramoyl-L-alanyl-D-glutamate--2,6-diaminopimelate ligase [Clostridium sp.]|jgi:UDP-N-acetylmuramoyl-L-alanyl-D-glutamate--2,6-diaminopimelate ligase|uniref:UDP-N-acetylmuramoyl-L-alanyl-D-glutamate--2, 6-diaminopimelate ligase n=1 Tax=Clostridium sp. TaxID=1506 RepID=UPI0025BD3752|nr:UDP-N-acetylmuramoyl-L-alanyl-D-glutamate--2,6-diaminopimelate ligase [Clostridium sp.]MCH3964192.1 UDP-N-acetylmuramoyl-L-alanyl-D-glutamate--2,6-diaminopimelate ligase [Clostridium sp.]MCI1715373.1 UDP-N-acetylmuramoyl-L-alanyl-D-glutamate--2,6-diaminopimelate ligase [Clostridium sp.]MCI1799836.1 UDP-N-acetylmuramoyl-L-alanyl-D-glutamate--2,6-diaminopimelate ligase [Clostridium sp.]MCI1813556.1 UDP-N-acetylmuramoyl-L-alanyl-D-glutamate--2,6-diaminopimelate ligase [Clostridium sp.]MCI18706
MKLKSILCDIDYKVVKGTDNVDIKQIQYDSRRVKNGDLFICIEGYKTDGHKYAGDACKNGASVVVCSKNIDNLPDCTVVMVGDCRKVLAAAASNYYGNPAEKIKIIGVTGTNGKTTTTFMIKSILEEAGYKVGLVGTIANYIGSKKLHSDRTTPESLELQKLFGEMVDCGVDYCVMEVSSHSLYLNRVYGVEFSQAVFTNLTRDHLDFHKTFENYYRAKLILFENTLNSIINIDDKYGKRVYEDAGGSKVTYGTDTCADIRAYNLDIHSRGAGFDVTYKGKKEHINLNIPGKYNVMNALGSIGACISEGIDMDTVRSGLEKMLAVPGRCEIVTHGYNLGYEVIVDYAHTPDGLENILKTAREFTGGRLIAVYGCGGDRDNTKRPIMGEIGTKLSDFAIITSDNPRSEDPMHIIDEVVDGIKGDNYIVIENRREAIKTAIDMAEKGDVIVIAGKGHEDYQILKDRTIHFDEREIVREIIDRK